MPTAIDVSPNPKTVGDLTQLAEFTATIAIFKPSVVGNMRPDGSEVTEADAAQGDPDVMAPADLAAEIEADIRSRYGFTSAVTVTRTDR